MPTDAQTIPPLEDEDLLDENDVSEQRQIPVKKRRSRGKNKDDGPVKHRAFVESSVKNTLARQDPIEMMNRWDWESGEYEVSIKRVQPQSFRGRNQ